jgi:hypothetical protein
MTSSRPREQRDDTRGSLVRAVETGQVSSSLLDDFDALEPVWTAPALTGFEARAA